MHQVPYQSRRYHAVVSPSFPAVTPAVEIGVIVVARALPCRRRHRHCCSRRRRPRRRPLRVCRLGGKSLVLKVPNCPNRRTMEAIRGAPKVKRRRPRRPQRPHVIRIIIAAQEASRTTSATATAVLTPSPSAPFSSVVGRDQLRLCHKPAQDAIEFAAYARDAILSAWHRVLQGASSKPESWLCTRSGEREQKEGNEERSGV